MFCGMFIHLNMRIGKYMEEIKFLGVYSSKLLSQKENQTQVGTGRQSWFIWYNKQAQSYIAQISSALGQPVGAPVTISPMQFGLNFTEEPTIKFSPPAMLDVSTVKTSNTTKQKEVLLGTSVKNIATYTKLSPGSMQKISSQDDTKVVVSKIMRDIEKESFSLPMPGEKNSRIVREEQFSDYSEGDALGTSSADSSGDFLLPKQASSKKIDSIRAFNLGKRFKGEFESALGLWRKGKKALAVRKFYELLKKEEIFIEAHKHMFTEFAIELRKMNQNDLAIGFALRCADLSPDDSHTYFNVARLYYEFKNYTESVFYLDKALELEPDLFAALSLQTITKRILDRMVKLNEGKYLL